MTRYLLDTNIISNLSRPKPSASLLAWLGDQRDEDLFIATMTLAEIRRGILQMPVGRKRDAVESWFAGARGPSAFFAGRIKSFDERAALCWAHLMAEASRMGRPRDRTDTIIASIAVSQGCVVVTDNERDFFGFRLINPLRGMDQ